METELKTLNELMEGLTGCGIEGRDVLFHKARAEAVKWVKCFERKKDMFIKSADNYDEVMASNQGKINIFKHFFNLTEEDLKC